MALPEIEGFLEQTLDDRRLSGQERRALQDALLLARTNPHELAVLRARAFDLARAEIDDPASREIVTWLEGVIKLLLPATEQPSLAQAYFSPEDDCAAVIAGLIGRSSERIDCCVFTITDNRISNELKRAQQRDVAIRIISDDDKSHDLGSDIPDLRRLGLSVRCDDSPHHMHHKFAIFDRKAVLTGSYNWTRSASRDNQENVLVSTDPRLLRAFETSFERLWADLS